MNMTTNYLTQKIFTSNRALGGGLCMLGFTLGNMTGPLLIDYLISTYGWRGTLMIQAAFTANIIPFSLVIPDVTNKHKPNSECRDIKSTNQKTDDNLFDECESHDEARASGDAFPEMTSCKSKKKNQLCKSRCHCSNTNLSVLRDIFDFSLFRKLAFTWAIIDGMADRFNLNLVRQHMPSRAVYLGMTRTDGATFLFGMYPMCGSIKFSFDLNQIHVHVLEYKLMLKN